MLDKIIEFSLKNKLIIIFIALIILILGIYFTYNINIDVFPDLTAPTVTILTEAHGNAPEEVETLVTFPIESAVNGATGVRRVRSNSSAGFSIVWVEFEWGIDILSARQIVSEKLQIASANFPEGVDNPVLAPITSIMGEIMLIGIRSDSFSLMDVRTIVDWTIRRRILAIPGVSQVLVIGGDQKQYHILVRPEKLKDYNISLKEVVDAAKNSNINSSGGFFIDKGQEFLIRSYGRVNNIEDIKNSVITIRGNTPILFKDIAEVKIGSPTKIGYAAVNRKPAVILLIQKQPEANTQKITKNIDIVIEDLKKVLPEELEIENHIFRQSDFIEIAIRNITNALLYGALLVVIILFIFLANIRTTFISVLAIPLSILITLIFFRVFNITINTMSLGGIAIAVGVLVDDAIINVENIFRRLKENLQKTISERKPVFDVIYSASKEIRSPIVYATLIIIVVFLPVFFLSGVEGRLLKPLGIAFIVSLLASLLVALTVIPALSYFLLPKSKSLIMKKDSLMVNSLKKIYLHVLNFTINKPKSIIAVSIVLLLIAVGILPFFGRSFLPEFNEGMLTLSVITLPGTSIDESNKIGDLVEKILLSYPEVISTSRRTGRAELEEHSQGVYSAEIDVRIDLKGKPKEKLLEELRQSLSSVPGTSITIGQPIGHRIDHMLSGTRANIAIKIFGPDLYKLRSIAQAIENQIHSIKGVADLAVEQQTDVPQVRIKGDRLAMAKYGLSAGELSNMIDIAFNGETVSKVFEEQKSFDLVVRFNEENRSNLEQIKAALFDTPLGPKIPLYMLANITEEKGPNVISREDVQRKIVVQCNVSGMDLRGVVNEIRKTIEQNIKLPEEYYIEYGGQFESEEQATKIITIISLFSLAIIFLLLYMEFSSTKIALLMLSNLPLALIGGIFTIYLTDKVINVASLIGFITLLGISTRNGIMMISHYRQLIEVEGKNLKDAIIQGSLERLSPILMTALTTGLALLPLAFAADKPGSEIEHPMAVVILGGLLTATFLNLIVIPSIYLKFGEN